MDGKRQVSLEESGHLVESHSGYFFDYEFRTAPVRGLFPNKSHDPLYLCDEAGRPFAWADGTVIDLNAPPAGPLYLADETGTVFAGPDAVVLTVE